MAVKRAACLNTRYFPSADSLVAGVSRSSVHAFSMSQLILAPALLAAATGQKCCTAAHAEQCIADQAVLVVPTIECRAAYLSAYEKCIGSWVCLQHVAD